MKQRYVEAAVVVVVAYVFWRSWVMVSYWLAIMPPGILINAAASLVGAAIPILAAIIAYWLSRYFERMKISWNAMCQFEIYLNQCICKFNDNIMALMRLENSLRAGNVSFDMTSQIPPFSELNAFSDVGLKNLAFSLLLDFDRTNLDYQSINERNDFLRRALVEGNLSHQRFKEMAIPLADTIGRFKTSCLDINKRLENVLVHTRIRLEKQRSWISPSTTYSRFITIFAPTDKDLEEETEKLKGELAVIDIGKKHEVEVTSDGFTKNKDV